MYLICFLGVLVVMATSLKLTAVCRNWTISLLVAVICCGSIALASFVALQAAMIMSPVFGRQSSSAHALSRPNELASQRAHRQGKRRAATPCDVTPVNSTFYCTGMRYIRKKNASRNYFRAGIDPRISSAGVPVLPFGGQVR
jgi:hypothetical protein